jgi:FAD/FMN-containing dehydrogenase
MPIPNFVGARRVKFKNYVNDQEADPLNYFRPTTLQELQDIVVEAEGKGYRVKAIGSGHSSSDIGLTRDYMIDTWGLNRVLDKKWLNLKLEAATDRNLYFLECGIRLKDLIKFLDGEGKALINMGAYTGQTLAGVLSTSTHGSGILLGAFPSYVEAIILLGECGKLYHIERSGARAISNGPVKLDGFGGIQFWADDDKFKAVAVSMGCMGIIYAVVLRVTDAYMLEENRFFSKWHLIQRELAYGDLLQTNRHVEVLVDPYPDKMGEYRCLVTKRCIPKVPKKRPLIKKGHRKFIYEVGLTIVPSRLVDFFMRTILNHFPKCVPWMAGFLITSLTDRDYVDKSYKVLDLGKANNLAAFATEICFPKDKYIAATEALIRIVAQSVRDGSQYLGCPFSLRFVQTNDLYLSMQYEGDRGDYVCMIEFPTVSETIGAMEMLGRIEFAMYDFGGIPHWGQINHVACAGQSAVDRLYPDFGKWLAVYRKLCPKGTFQNDFMRRCGIA